MRDLSVEEMKDVSGGDTSTGNGYGNGGGNANGNPTYGQAPAHGARSNDLIDNLGPGNGNGSAIIPIPAPPAPPAG
jgi:hypothetical protein